MSTTDAGPPAVVGGRYTLGDLIGRGGAADVYRARDELLGRDVAIKMFGAGGEVVAAANAEGAPDEREPDHARYGPGESSRPSAPPAELVGDLEEGSDARNRREVLTLAALSHPGLVTVYDVGDDHGRAYFVMQLIEGDTLAQRIRRGPLALGDVVALAAALADALGYVHRRGVVHRDVKPGNVLLDADGRAHLSDFGIAAVRDAAPVTAAGMVIGTASYLSPEQVRGESVTPAVDVYALGLVLIECLTGRREYPGNALEAAVARLHRSPAVPTGLPDTMRTLLVAMTADEPTARPDADEVLGAVRALSREIGLDAETVLSPALMSAPTGVMPAPGAVAGYGASGPAAWAYAPGQRTGVDTPTGFSAPARPRRRALLVTLGVALAAVLVAGSAIAYTLVSREQPANPPPAASAVPAAPPPPVPSLFPTTTERAETVESTTRERTTTRRTTTTPRAVAPTVAPAPVVPPVVAPVVPAPVVTTTTTTPRSDDPDEPDDPETPGAAP